MAPVRKIKKPLKKTRRKPSAKKLKKHSKKRVTLKNKARARKVLSRMEYAGSNFSSMQHYSTIDDTPERKKLEEMGFHIKSLSYSVREEISHRLREFESQSNKSVYTNIFAMLTASNALRSKYGKIINTTHLPFFEDIQLFHKDLLLLRLSSLADILEPAKKYESTDLALLLINRTSSTLSKISDNFPKKSLESNIFTDLNRMFTLEPLLGFIEFCRQVGNDIGKMEKHAKTINLHDAYIEKFSDY